MRDIQPMVKYVKNAGSNSLNSLMDTASNVKEEIEEFTKFEIN